MIIKGFNFFSQNINQLSFFHMDSLLGLFLVYRH